MFKNVNYILVKDIKRFKLTADIGTISLIQQRQITEIFEETVKAKNTEKSSTPVNNGFVYYFLTKKTFILLFAENPIPEAKAFSIIEKIVANSLDIKLLRNSDDEFILHYIYNIVDCIFEEDEYIDLRISGENCEPFFVNKYREALLTISSDMILKNSETNFQRNKKLIIAMSIIVIGIILAVVIPSVI
jgi:hypothetical protein